MVDDSVFGGKRASTTRARINIACAFCAPRAAARRSIARAHHSSARAIGSASCATTWHHGSMAAA